MAKLPPHYVRKTIHHCLYILNMMHDIGAFASKAPCIRMMGYPRKCRSQAYMEFLWLHSKSSLSCKRVHFISHWTSERSTPDAWSCPDTNELHSFLSSCSSSLPQRAWSAGLHRLPLERQFKHRLTGRSWCKINLNVMTRSLVVRVEFREFRWKAPVWVGESQFYQVP